jgi:hypothetical protein
MTSFTHDLITVIIRLHTTGEATLSRFSQALFSLAGSTHQPLEPLIVTQQFTDLQLQTVRKLVDEFVWSDPSLPRIVNFTHPETRDHRSALLNLGLETGRGRYVAFLDYDDYVYEHAYETLIARLQECTSAVAMGGCIAAHIKPDSRGGLFTIKKEPKWNESSDEAFLGDNAFPIHSFVIDRSRLGNAMPKFNEGLTRLEDFEFLLRLRLVTTFDRRCQRQPLVEYTMQGEASGAPGSTSPKDAGEWEAARAVIEPLKELVARTIGLPA